MVPAPERSTNRRSEDLVARRELGLGGKVASVADGGLGGAGDADAVGLEGVRQTGSETVGRRDEAGKTYREPQL